MNTLKKFIMSLCRPTVLTDRSRALALRRLLEAGPALPGPKLTAPRRATTVSPEGD